MTVGFPNNAGWRNEQRETVRDFVTQHKHKKIRFNDSTDENNSAWHELIEVVHNDTSAWDTDTLDDLGLYARTINNSISSDKGYTDKIQTLVTEIFTHLAFDVEREQKTNPFNRTEWNWVQGLVDTTPGEYVKLPLERGNDDRQTVGDLLKKARSTNSQFVFVVIPGKTTQKISTRLLERLLNTASDASRLVNLLYRPPVWNEQDDRFSKPSIDLVFASQTIQEALNFEGTEGDTTRLFADNNALPQRALEWLNKHIYDLEHAPIDQVDIFLLRDLIKSAQFLAIDRFHEMCLRRFMDVASPAQQKEFPNLISQCIYALSSVQTFPESYEEMTDQVQKFREIIHEARGRDIPMTQSTPLSTIVELIVEARRRDAPNLLLMFETMCERIPAEKRPHLSGDQTSDAETVRTWMRRHKNALDLITGLFFDEKPLQALPFEINLLNNLESLNLMNTQVTDWPFGFNPKKLNDLWISNTQINTWPAFFTGQNLHALYVNNTPMTALPAGFKGQNLQRLDISNTQITWPVGLNPKNLGFLCISNTQINELPFGFTPKESMILICSDEFYNNLSPDIKNLIQRH